MDRVQRDQCRLLINLPEFQIHRLAPGEVGEEGKSEISSPGEEALPLVLRWDCYLQVRSPQVTSELSRAGMMSQLASRGVRQEFG